MAIPSHAIAPPTEAVASFAVLTDASAANVGAHANPAAVALELRPALCGDEAACTAVRAAMTQGRSLRFDVRPVASWGMPSPQALAGMSASLTPDERASIAHLGTVIVVTAHGPTTPDAMVARVGWAATSALAGALHGLVYDETVHRIESATTFASHAITAPLAAGGDATAAPGASAWRDDRVAVQLYEQPDGTARLLTLGMRRFGAPDLEIEGAPMSAGRPLGSLVNLVAKRLVEGASTAPLRVTAGDGAPDVDLVAAPHHEGDPDNTVLRIVPAVSAGPDTPATDAEWDALVTRAVGKVDDVTSNEPRALAAIASRAREQLPGAIDRWSVARDAGASLLVKLPFPVTGKDGETHDGGALEWMWVAVTGASAQTLSGTLANTPVYVADLRSGSRVTGQRRDVADYVLDLGHGTKEGGDSIRALENAENAEAKP